MVTPPKVGDHLILELFPEKHVLLMTLNRPKQLNAISMPLEEDIGRVLDWVEEEPSVWVTIVTGAGRAFCAGQDLKSIPKDASRPNGFASISVRRFGKPIIAAVNGLALGGGAEICLGCDVIIGHKGGVMGFPEVRRGLIAPFGGITALQTRAPVLAPYLLAGTPIPPHLLELHIYTECVEKDQVLPTAFKWAAEITKSSPNAVQSTKNQMNMYSLDGEGVGPVTIRGQQEMAANNTLQGENMAEGVRAFIEKREPAWKNPPPRKLKSKL